MDEPISTLKKILFVDEPFMESSSLRSKRSRFLWEVLSSAYDADLLLLKTTAYIEKPVPAHTGYDRLYSLSLADANQLFPDSYHILASGQAERFANMLDSKRYELIVFAGLSCLPLLYLAKKTLPRCKYVIDIDRNYLPEAEARWKANKSLEAAKNLWVYTRQLFWDKFLLKPGSYCFFANPYDAVVLQGTFKLKPQNTLVFPLPMEEPQELTETEPATDLAGKKYILFWGLEGSTANLEAAKILVSEIYPRISKKLVEKDIGIVLYGHEQLKSVCGGRIQYSEPGDTPDATFAPLLDNAMFALLPLNVPDTEGRIMQCASAGKALICTNKCLTGWQLPDNCAKTHDALEELAPLIIRWMQYPREVEASAHNLQQYCKDNYQRQALIDNILSTLNTWTGENEQ
ncbi:MAG: hypothetical protein CVU50_03530 [Candidatus Cloacimonetes bacterium HGW-Cloacimonetes-3]|nr:MAG: hypothetical protein CVU50_03530 [Candidatus Cloacimonetes bacterium HGW-Cloacimonetes-3]